MADEYLHELNPDASLVAFGQDHNPESHAICGSDMLIKGQNVDHLVFGSSCTKDGFSGEIFDYLLANPPCGVKWEAERGALVKKKERLIELLEEKRAALISRAVTGKIDVREETLDAELIRRVDKGSKSARHASYAPFRS